MYFPVIIIIVLCYPGLSLIFEVGGDIQKNSQGFKQL